MKSIYGNAENMTRLSLICVLFFLSINSFAQLEFNDTLLDLDGNQIAMNELKTDDIPSMIYFWNMGCTPCILTFNYIRKNEGEWKSKGFRIIAVAIQPYNEKMAEKIKTQQWPFDIYFYSDSKLLKDFQEEFLKETRQISYPQAFIYDADWNFIKFKSGGKVILKDEFKKEGWSDDLVLSQAMENGEYSKLTTDLSIYYLIRSSIK
ncbi:peroxiredoxin family protein [Ekhidna sp. To15]|uniref:peroxiredoxin family protein n=1 Tax=Ekhidna sp. To15 TaxID=3395267 RepID=UPI003F520C54